MYYILDENNKPIKVDSHQWSEWYYNFDTNVMRTEIDKTSVSTVFIGIGSNFRGEIPALWETMCFSDNEDYNNYQERYCTYDEAVAGHKHCVNMVETGQPLNIRKELKIKFKI